MMTVVDNSLVNESIELPEEVSFTDLYLWSLRRGDVRRLVTSYNNSRFIADDTKVLNKVVSDLEVLNIPRTPLNCLTILKVSEANFDDTPVNRTEMLRKVLFLLFNVDQIPTYKSKPDLKDTEFVLGYFSEKLLRQKKYYFDRHFFNSTLNAFCNENELDLEIEVIFDVLFMNNIIVMRDKEFSFKFSYWIFYFAAHRMHHSQEFTNFIFTKMNYASYPEIVEFYTGIDRKRNDAITVLIEDIKSLRESIIEKAGVSHELSIYSDARWNPTEESLKKLQEDVSGDVEKSKLPNSVKDRYADKSYNPIKPLNQTVNEIIEEYSLLRLMKTIKACSNAIRNSDFADKNLKHQLLNEILISWSFITKIILILTPILSEKGRVSLEGANFCISDDFGKTSEERFTGIISAIPSNVTGWYRDDLFSNKMGPMLFKYIENNDDPLITHFLTLLIINKRPNKWKEYVNKVIQSEHKNSFYLSDLAAQLMSEYQYSYLDKENLSTIEELIKKAIAKHDLGIKKPNDKSINRLNAEGYKLPKRVVPEE